MLPLLGIQKGLKSMGRQSRPLTFLQISLFQKALQSPKCKSSKPPSAKTSSLTIALWLKLVISLMEMKTFEK